MSTIEGGVNIVNNGLILYLDSANIRSYNGISNIWYDLSTSLNNGTLNGPTFSSVDGGVMIFDGVNDYVTLSNRTTTSFTIGCWIKTSDSSPSGSQAYEGNGIIWSDVGGFANDFILAILNDKAAWFTGDVTTTISSTTTINTGSWFYLTAVKNGSNNTKHLFINGVLESSGVSSSTLLTDNSNIIIGGNTIDSRYFNGNISMVQIYNRVLTTTEIEQNYNAMKKRYEI
jgi:hypothetical protein